MGTDRTLTAYICCESCPQLIEVGDVPLSDRKAYLRRAGWAGNGDQGWLCPGCLEPIDPLHICDLFAVIVYLAAASPQLGEAWRDRTLKQIEDIRDWIAEQEEN